MVYHVQGVSDLIDKMASGFGKAHTASIAVKQGIFQCPDACADTGLTNAKAAGRMTEAEELSYGQCLYQ